MKLSLNWLNRFIDLEGLSEEELSSKLTMSAFEVEDIEKIGPELKGPILVGKILKIDKHPNADRLSVTKVTTDGKDEHQIICGAKNIEEGQIIPVSLPGAEVVNRKDGTKLKIKEAKIRDIESFGMLCAPSELGIESEQADGILILDKDAPVGENLIDYLSLGQDTVLEVGSRSNRGDALSVRGLSKEISAITKKELKEIKYPEPKIDNSVKSTLPRIENEKDTYVFYTVAIENVEVKESPGWLKSLLNSVGIRSINNLVDITNYINYGFGQPMHAYDKEKLNGALTSRVSKNGEVITTLDGKERILKENVLVIADDKSPVAIAGIMGGQESEVSNSTTKIVLEAATFSPIKVRKGAREVGLTSEASKRFERGVDSCFTFNALLKAIELIEEIASPSNNKVKVGKIEKAGEPIDLKLKINLTGKEVKRVLDVNLTSKEIANILEPLNFKCKEVSNECTEVTIPSDRQIDVTREIDLVEEVARIYGYNNFPAVPPKATIAANKSINISGEIKKFFISSGFSETYLSSLIGEKILSYKDFSFDDEKAIKMLNPLSREHFVLRQSLIPGLCEVLKLNQSYQNTNIRLFEVGKKFLINTDKASSEKEANVIETLCVSGICSGIDKSWYGQTIKNPREYLFFFLKGILENLPTTILKSNFDFKFKKASEKFLHPNYSLEILLEGEKIGILGSLHPKLEKELNSPTPIIVFEISLKRIAKLFENIFYSKRFKKISTQPAVERDLTVDISKKYTSSEIKENIEKTASKAVTSIKLIGIYELDKDTRSLTFRLKLQDPEQTLTSKQVDSEVSKIIKQLTTCFEASFRV